MKDYKNKEKGTLKNSEKEGEIIPDRQIRICLDSYTKHKGLLKAKQNNHNPMNYKSKSHCYKGIIRVDIQLILQHTLEYYQVERKTPSQRQVKQYVRK